MIDDSNSTGTRRNSTSKVKKDNKNPLDSTKDNSTSIASIELDDIIDSKKENKEKEQLSYYEKQVLKELKGIRKASKNILKTMKKINV